MAFTKRSLTQVVLLSSLAAASVLSAACNVQFDAAFVRSTAIDADNDGEAGRENNVPSGGGTGGTGGDITLPQPPPPPDATSSFTDLCGDGCMAGVSAIGCSVPMDPDGGPELSCQIVPTDNGPSSQCLPPGTYDIDEPCTRASDCTQGLGCVVTGSGVGACRPYCCGHVEACEAGTYCALAPMAEDVISAVPMNIPVCIPATACTLLDDVSCPEGQTCTLVRLDGTTSCVTPGPGLIDDSCPCAPGHVCVKATNKCVALCHTGGSDCPDGMFCQGGADAFPDGIGSCVK